jgi:hypothetical protein
MEERYISNELEVTIMRYEVLIKVSMKITVLWGASPYNMVYICQRLRIRVRVTLRLAVYRKSLLGNKPL